MTGQRTGRRGNGEGSIYQLADGRWRGSVFLGYRNGKPHRKYLTRRTRTEVAAEIRRLLEAQRQGQLVTTGTMTVGEWLGTYLEQVARPKIRSRTYDRYRSDIERHIVPAIGRHRLDKLRPGHLPGPLQRQDSRGPVRKQRPAYPRGDPPGAERRGQISADHNQPGHAGGLSAGRAARDHSAVGRRGTAPDPRGARDRMAARWLVGLALGLRQGEALGLWWDDIDLDTGLLRVRRSLQRQHGGGLVFTEPKTHRSKRTIRFPRRWSRHCASTSPARRRNALPPGRSGWAARVCSPRRSGRPSIRATISASSRSCWPKLSCPRSGFMISAIPQPVSCWLRTSRPVW